MSLHSRMRVLNGLGGVAGFTAARGKPAPSHTANVPTMLVICALVSTAFPPWLLVPAPVPPPVGYWHSGMCGQVLGSACFSARSVPGSYSWHSHANSYANKKGES